MFQVLIGRLVTNSAANRPSNTYMFQVLIGRLVTNAVVRLIRHQAQKVSSPYR